MFPSAHFIEEPELVFGHGQRLPSPKDGLYLFGPLSQQLQKGELRCGVIGTASGIHYLQEWLSQVSGFIRPEGLQNSIQYRPFPGFANVFGVGWPRAPIARIEVSDAMLAREIRLSDRHQAVYNTVDIFLNELSRYGREEDLDIDLWFVVVPEDLYRYCRPMSLPPEEERVAVSSLVDRKSARALSRTPSLFDDFNQDAEPYFHEVNFHNQLKARLIQEAPRPVVQIIRESTLAPSKFQKSDGSPLRRLQDRATVSWNLCTTAYFKAVGRPWRLAELRDGVCYVGLVFKQLPLAPDGVTACCGAQMFLDSGDGLVFKGAVGPWRSPESEQYHLSREGARDLISLVTRTYHKAHGRNPRELFIHGQTFFSDEEWNGFRSGVPDETNLVGVRIASVRSLKLFRKGTNPVLRGTTVLDSPSSGYLWTRGYVPYLETYPGRENPNPLRVDVVRGAAEILQVMTDIMALTKVNFNACIYGDGMPVTLRFADSVGEILTAAPERVSYPPLPFKYYI
jgi:hypothetical protein